MRTLRRYTQRTNIKIKIWFDKLTIYSELAGLKEGNLNGITRKTNRYRPTAL